MCRVAALQRELGRVCAGACSRAGNGYFQRQGRYCNGGGLYISIDCVRYLLGSLGRTGVYRAAVAKELKKQLEPVNRKLDELEKQNEELKRQNEELRVQLAAAK